MAFLKTFLTASIVMLIMDTLWLGYIAKPLYMQHLKPFFNLDENGLLVVNYYAAGIVYLCLVLGVLLFALPKTETCNISVFLHGFVFGVIVYAVFDFTNMAIMKDWPLYISLIDVAWGGFLCGTTSYITNLMR